MNLVRATGAVSTAVHTAADPAVELAERAAREALFTSGLDGNNDHDRMTCWMGVSKGAMQAMTLALNRVPGRDETGKSMTRMVLPARPPSDTPLAVALGPHGYLALHLRKRLGVSDVRCLAAACASGLTAVHLARTALLESNTVHALVVSSEAALLPAFVHSYRKLGVLPPLNPAQYRASPLDRHRAGFMLSELAAAVVLQRVDHVLPGQIELLDTAIAAEGYDLIRPAPGMPALAHVARSLLSGRTIDMLHPHATGTAEHDPAEMDVHSSILGPNPPDVYAVKGALGHGLGAAGLVSLVIACLCARSRQRPPMPWLTDPIPCALPLNPQASSLKPCSTHAVFAAGFGGHVAGAVIRRI